MILCLLSGAHSNLVSFIQDVVTISSASTSAKYRSASRFHQTYCQHRFFLHSPCLWCVPAGLSWDKEMGLLVS